MDNLTRSGLHRYHPIYRCTTDADRCNGGICIDASVTPLGVPMLPITDAPMTGPDERALLPDHGMAIAPSRVPSSRPDMPDPGMHPAELARRSRHPPRAGRTRRPVEPSGLVPVLPQPTQRQRQHRAPPGRLRRPRKPRRPAALVERM